MLSCGWGRGQLLQGNSGHEAGPQGQSTFVYIKGGGMHRGNPSFGFIAGAQAVKSSRNLLSIKGKIFGGHP